jgi:hypothetical protein
VTASQFYVTKIGFQILVDENAIDEKQGIVVPFLQGRYPERNVTKKIAYERIPEDALTLPEHKNDRISPKVVHYGHGNDIEVGEDVVECPIMWVILAP